MLGVGMTFAEVARYLILIVIVVIIVQPGVCWGE
jgi:hypothetical protein